jgi:hypothetical protein
MLNLIETGSNSESHPHWAGSDIAIYDRVLSKQIYLFRRIRCQSTTCRRDRS